MIAVFEFFPDSIKDMIYQLEKRHGHINLVDVKGDKIPIIVYLPKEVKING